MILSPPLSPSCTQVVGVEYSGRFTDAAVQIQEGRGVVYSGEDGTRCEARLPDHTQPNKVVFKQVHKLSWELYTQYHFQCWESEILHEYEFHDFLCS